MRLAGPLKRLPTFGHTGSEILRLSILAGENPVRRVRLMGLRIAIVLTLILITIRDLSAQKPIVIDFGIRGGVLPGQPLESNLYCCHPNSLPTLTFDNSYGTTV